MNVSFALYIVERECFTQFIEAFYISLLLISLVRKFAYVSRYSETSYYRVPRFLAVANRFITRAQSFLRVAFNSVKAGVHSQDLCAYYI